MILPCCDCSCLPSISSRDSTIVLATDTIIPITTPCSAPQPSSIPTPSPSSADSATPSWRSDQRHPLDFAQFVERELQSDGEHQEDDADLGDNLEGVGLAYRRTWRERADEDSRQHVAENQRLSQPPRQRTSQDGSDEDVRQLFEDDGMLSHVSAPGNCNLGILAGRENLRHGVGDDRAAPSIDMITSERAGLQPYKGMPVPDKRGHHRRTARCASQA